MTLRRSIYLPWLCTVTALTNLVQAQVLDPLVVTVSRAPRPLSELPVSVDVFSPQELTANASLTVRRRP
ncbi:MAG: hypothetical protein J6386_16435 [Candidatus Synoicihabitans palmerolidicus]|nr:hypothetical protein [Candidatus Synoicihabitans palmerolidicus]